MSYILFNNSETKYENISVSIRPTQTQTGNAIEIIFPDNTTFEVNATGFKLYNDDDTLFKDYSNATTVYYENYGVHGYMLSDDRTVYKKPAPTVTFITGFGGNLEGETLQSVNKYNELSIPTPVADTNYEFVEWQPTIPQKGNVIKNTTYTAIFVYVEPLEKVIENKIDMLNKSCSLIIENGTAVNIGGKDYHFTYHKVDDQTNIKELFDATVSTNQPVSYHADGEECRDWTTLQFAKIYLTLAGYKSNNVSYFNALKHYVMSLTDKEAIEVVQYGDELTGEYLETYNHATETNTNLMAAILVKNGLTLEDVLGA